MSNAAETASADADAAAATVVQVDGALNGFATLMGAALVLVDRLGAVKAAHGMISSQLGVGQPVTSVLPVLIGLEGQLAIACENGGQSQASPLFRLDRVTLQLERLGLAASEATGQQDSTNTFCLEIWPGSVLGSMAAAQDAALIVLCGAGEHGLNHELEDLGQRNRDALAQQQSQARTHALPFDLGQFQGLEWLIERDLTLPIASAALGLDALVRGDALDGLNQADRAGLALVNQHLNQAQQFLALVSHWDFLNGDQCVFGLDYAVDLQAVLAFLEGVSVEKLSAASGEIEVEVKGNAQILGDIVQALIGGESGATVQASSTQVVLVTKDATFSSGEVEASPSAADLALQVLRLYAQKTGGKLSLEQADRGLRVSLAYA